VIVCAQCGRESPSDASFCAGCGAPLAAKPPTPREERKVVTVLFADPVGRRPEADAELVQALAFYRSVGATFYIRRGEELLAAAS